jgi:hypothetical protein
MNVHCLPRIEWDFDDVPASELTACCWWEYARESASLRRIRDEIVAEWRDRGANREWTIGGYERTLQFFRGTNSRASLVLLLVVDKPPGITKSKTKITHDAFGSSFPAPWQSLSNDERSGWANAINGEWDDSGISRQERIYPNELYREYSTFPGREKGGKAEENGSIPNTILYPQGREATLLEIAWGQYTNEQLVRAFRNWLKRSRPEGLPGPDGRGRGIRVAHADLVRLGVMRLLSRFTALQILDPQRNACPEIWQARQFARNKWQDPTKWYDARREGGRVFRRLFPALPRAEIPLSWKRIRPVPDQ